MTTYKLENNVYTTLTDSISNTTDTITINVASSPFNSPPALSEGETGILTIVDSTRDPKKIEIINYSNVVYNGDGTIDLTGVTRGRDGTNGQTFSYGAVVLQSITTSIISNVVESAGSSIDSLSDIDTTGVSSEYLLVYNASTETWEPSGIGADFLSDVDVSGAVDNDLLVYDASTGTWGPSAIGINHLSDVDVSGAVDNDFMVYNESTETWEPSGMGFGNAAFRDYYISTADPTSSDGEDGDVWYKVS